MARVAAEAQAGEQRNQAVAMVNLVEVTARQSEVAKRQLEIQERNMRIGTRPRFSVECISATDQTRVLRVYNAGAFAPEVGLSILEHGEISSCSLEGNYIDIDPESSFQVVLQMENPQVQGGVIFRLQLGLSDSVDVRHLFQVLDVGPCRLIRKELLKVA